MSSAGGVAAACSGGGAWPDLMPADIIGTNIIVEDADGSTFISRARFLDHILIANGIKRLRVCQILKLKV